MVKRAIVFAFMAYEAVLPRDIIQCEAGGAKAPPFATPEMIRAGEIAYEEALGSFPPYMIVQRVYKAMIAAREQSPRIELK